MLNQLLIICVALFAVLSFSLGLFSILKNPKSWTIRLWFFLTLAITFWSANLVLVMLAETAEQGLRHSQLLHVGAAFIPILFFHFVLLFVFQHSKISRALLLTGYLLSILFVFLSFSPRIVSGVAARSGFDFWVEAGDFYYLYILNFWIFVALAIFYLVKHYSAADGIMKRKINFFLIATLVGFGGGGTSFLPQTLDIYPFGNYVAWFYPILITYGIFMDEINVKIKY